MMQMQLMQFSNGTPPYQQSLFNTNDVLVQEVKVKGSTRTIYYLPCYINFKVKEITSLDITGLKATFAATLVFSFYYGKLDKDILNQFTGASKDDEKYIFLQFSRQKAIELKTEKDGVIFSNTQSTQIVKYVVRRQFTCGLFGKVFYAPFEMIYLYLNFTVQTISLNPQANNGKKIYIEFNCMQSNKVIMLHHGLNRTFGNYHIANYLSDSKFDSSQENPFHKLKQEDKKEWKKSSWEKITNYIFDSSFKNSQGKPFKLEQEDKNESSRERKNQERVYPKHFRYVHFNIPMYKYPGVELIQIFVPLWILGLINLFIFFQDRSLGGRIGGIATLTLAFIAFIPTINGKITKSPSIKMVEILVYMQAAASMLCLIQSYLGRDITEPYDWTTDGFFLAALTLNLLTMFLVLVMFIVHSCFLQNNYRREKNQGKKERVWDRKDWYSTDCDREFEGYIRDGKIKHL